MFRKIWRRLTKPTFSVTTRANHDTTFGAVIAGQRTKICTIFICLHRDRILGTHQEEIDFPQPSIKSVPGVEVSYAEDGRPRRDVLQLDVYVRVTSAGNYSITPDFPEDHYNFRSIDNTPVSFNVKPSELKSIEVSSIAPIPGHGENGNPYRGGTVEILLTAKDEFGNTTIESDPKINIESENTFVTLLSTTRDSQKQRYVATLRCVKVGTTSFDLLLLLSHDHHLVVRVSNLTIIPPPASATNSYIIQNDLDAIQEIIHEAGQEISFNLALFDIFGYPMTSLDDTLANIRFACLHDFICEGEDDQRIIEKTETHDLQYLKKEERSQNGQSLDLGCHSANIFELQFTPSVSGAKRFVLFLSEKEVKNSPITITVEPGPLVEIQIVSHEPPILNQNVIISYPTEQRMVVVKGIDAFGNKVDLDCTEWLLSETKQVNMLEVKKSFLDEKTKRISFHYTHGKKGRYSVAVKPKSPANNCIKVPSFVIDVGTPPLDPKKCDVRICQEQPIFTGHFRCIKLLVVFVSCTGEKYVFPDRNIGHLTVTVDNTVFEPTFKHSAKPFEAYLTIPELQEGGLKKIQVRYKEVSLGCRVVVNVVGLVPFRADDYLEIDQNERKILCIGVAQKHFFGADHANIKNMNRILQKEYPDYKLSHCNVTQEYEGLAIFDFSSFHLEAFWRASVLLALLIRGTQHFRHQANEFGDEKEKWKERATEAYFAKDHQEAKECKAIKEKFGDLMNESHRNASDVIFHFCNYGRPQSQIDLHGQLVGNTEKSKTYKKQLLSKGEKSAAEVDAIIERERLERDEAIRKLDERLSNFDHEKAKRDGEDWLEIIVGAGHHSARGEQKIRPKVRQYLKKKEIEYVEANEGALLITFSPYTGTEPCVADFYCTQCQKKWTSAASWKGYYQRCFRCDSAGIDSKCYPLKMRSGPPPPRRQHAYAINFTRADHMRLCEMCSRLGRDCKLVSW